MSDVRVASLHVYPIKGCRGLAPPVAQVTATGLSTQGAADREWMVVDPTGRFVTQRELPQLALVAVAADAAGLTLHVPGAAALTVPFATAGPAMDVEVWRHQGRGLDAGDAAASWLSIWLGTPVRLVRFDRATPRACNPEYVGATSAHTLFADGYPLLVLGTASLTDLNARLAARGIGALPMNRFRPNVVLEGLPAYAEDHLDTITIGGVTLRCVKPCTRCSVTTTDQTTTQVGMEPLRTLGEYRMDERLGGVTFGMNAVVAQGAGHDIACGANVSVDYRF
jgi:uncharacterized protein YcbX